MYGPILRIVWFNAILCNVKYYLMFFYFFSNHFGVWYICDFAYIHYNAWKYSSNESWFVTYLVSECYSKVDFIWFVKHIGVFLPYLQSSFNRWLGKIEMTKELDEKWQIIRISEWFIQLLKTNARKKNYIKIITKSLTYGINAHLYIPSSLLMKCNSNKAKTVKEKEQIVSFIS